MKTLLYLICISFSLNLATAAGAWTTFGAWDDRDDIVMDDALLPAATWSTPAQLQMSDYNRIDTTDNSHPFRISNSPQLSFGSADGDNTIGFLADAGLSSEYGLTYATSLAWTVSLTSGGEIVECDVIFDPTPSGALWTLGPDNSNWFQSTALHELGHCRGLNHFDSLQSMQNSGQSKYLRDEVLYMDDKDAIRRNATTVTERDIVVHNKWHNGTSPQWMSMSPTTLREGDTIDFENVTVENRGSQNFGSDVEIAFYISTNATISNSDTRMLTASWSSFNTFTFSTFDISTTIPTVDDCGTYFAGAIVDPDDDWSERFEGNNNQVMTDGVPFTGTSFIPTPLTIQLGEDPDEPNDSRFSSTSISLPYSQSGLTIDQDSESDYYEFTLTEERKILALLNFEHANGDVELELQNSSGVVQANSTSSTDGEVIAKVLDAGTYHLRVYGDGAGSCNRYNLLALAADPSCGLGFESGLIVPLIFMLRGRLARRRQN